MQTTTEQQAEVSRALQDLQDFPPVTHRIRVEELAAKPIWTFGDLGNIVDVPTSTLNQVIADNPDTPAPFFLLGRRKVIFREDALKWLRDIADRNPWQPRRNNKSTTAK